MYFTAITGMGLLLTYPKRRGLQIPNGAFQHLGLTMMAMGTLTSMLQIISSTTAASFVLTMRLRVTRAPLVTEDNLMLCIVTMATAVLLMLPEKQVYLNQTGER